MHPALDIARVPRRPPPIDYAIVGVLFTWGLAEAIFAGGPGTTAQRVLVAAGYSLPLIVRRRYPIAALLVIASVLIPWALTADAPEQGAMPFPCLLVAAFSVGLHVGPARVAAIGLLVPVAAMVTVVGTTYFDGEAPGPVDVAILSFFVTGAWGSGRLLRRRAQQIAAARAEGGELAREAVVAERARIARELHDVVAHSVSIIAMQAGAAEQLVESRPAQAREHMETVRRTAQDALKEMRRLVEVLREDDATYAPQPTLDAVEVLVEEARAAGVTVALDVEGKRPELPPGIDLAAYRIVQEGLTNVAKHAPGADTRVRVGYPAGAIEIDVVNDPPRRQNGSAPDSGGHGLVGMRERVRLYGGTVDAGPLPDGGFAVHARLPVEEALA